MGVWDEFESEVHQASSIIRSGKCGVRLMLDQLKPEARKAVEATLANEARPHSAIAAALKRRVPDIAPRAYTVARHRRGECSCV